mmetsp:Transcript_17101/g.29265  ORF Transcript_17101/g.29265 Transcript_17101/m.29265 type:complete len:96 (+) Transcript_17101:408-695(+)
MFIQLVPVAFYLIHAMHIELSPAKQTVDTTLLIPPAGNQEVWDRVLFTVWYCGIRPASSSSDPCCFFQCTHPLASLALMGSACDPGHEQWRLAGT